MILVKGNLWDDPADLFLFPANSWLDRNGHLIMGAGCALEAKRRDPRLPEVIGDWLIEEGMDCREFWLWTPPGLGTERPRPPVIGAFQAKRFWGDRADLELIEIAASNLWRFLLDRPDWRVAMAFPGIGLGQLHREDVLPLLAGLPDQVRVYER